MNPQDTENHDDSKRKFLTTAAKIAYIAPLVMSLPANAGLRNCGSNKPTTFSSINTSSTDFEDDEDKHHHRH